MKCRFCNNELSQEFVNLGNSPPSNSFLDIQQLNEPEIFFPLKLFVCRKCWLVQIDEFKKSNEIFNKDYIYYSSYSVSWLKHCRAYVEMIIGKLGLDEFSNVIEVASNDGYLLQYFQQKKIPCMGIEPAENTANAAREKGIEVISEFFGEKLATRLADQNRKADLIIGNNVIAHVPNINDFVGGLRILLKSTGVVTMEFPHLMRLVEQNQFDTIYHEHFSYLSFHTVRSIFAAHRLELFDVEEIPTHGGSLRIYARHYDDSSKPVSKRVDKLLTKEIHAGMLKPEYYEPFQNKIDLIKNNLISFLIDQKKQKKEVAGYGAAAKGNTLLNYCGIKKDLLPFVADASVYKQGKYLPGNHIPVCSEEQIRKFQPDFVLILPWNLKSEISKQLEYIRKWNGKFVVAIPDLQIHNS
ncbi:MAG: methyltransferase domain-containing protein [Sedimentisphaerales bacterium]|nr:methyltransferase domain-containing protein [Sedimentisphaerales bacterium]